MELGQLCLVTRVLTPCCRTSCSPAGRHGVGLNAINQVYSGSLASKPIATSTKSANRSSSSLADRSAAGHSAADRLAAASMPIVDFEHVINRSFVDNLAATSTSTSKLHQLWDTSTSINESSASSTVTSRLHQLGGRRFGLGNLPPPVASSRLQPPVASRLQPSGRA